MRLVARRTAMIVALLYQLAAGASWQTNACATTFQRAVRPLTERDVLDYSVSTADAILIGRVLFQADTLSSYNVGPRRYLGQVRHIVVQPRVWLKGGGASRPTTIGFQHSLSQFESQKDWSQMIGADIVLFLADLGIDRAKTLHIYDDKDDWAVIEGPYMYGGGARLLRTTAESDLVRDVRNAIARLSVDSLATRSDLVALGHSNNSAEDCSVYGVRTQCLTITLDEVLRGTEERTTVPVYSVLGLIRSGPTLFFLKRMPEDTYEVISFAGGHRAVKNGHLKTGEALREVRVRLGHAPDGVKP